MRKKNPVPTTPAGYTPLMTRLPDSLITALREDAKRNVRSMNSQLIVVLAKYYNIESIEQSFVTTTPPARHSAE